MAQRIKRGDIVVVIAGKDKGKRGRVVSVGRDAERIVVEGVNKVVRHLKRNPNNPSEGGRVEREAPIHISNVMPWSDKDQKGVRVRSGVDKGKKVRISAASGEVLRAASSSINTGDKEEGGDE
ncbi:MAG: 50S ribosomal protein L24 [Planctomycetes bacterium]|nr:50S ribosomal protein L24 [Planctomycetota bacterium]